MIKHNKIKNNTEDRILVSSDASTGFSEYLQQANAIILTITGNSGQQTVFTQGLNNFLFSTDVNINGTLAVSALEINGATLATVAFTGNYDDLKNIPSGNYAQLNNTTQQDWTGPQLFSQVQSSNINQNSNFDLVNLYYLNNTFTSSANNWTNTQTFDGTHTITGLPTPINPKDAVNKSYVDNNVNSGVQKIINNDGKITITGTTTQPIISLNMNASNSWLNTQDFRNGITLAPTPSSAQTNYAANVAYVNNQIVSSVNTLLTGNNTFSGNDTFTGTFTSKSIVDNGTNVTISKPNILTNTFTSKSIVDNGTNVTLSKPEITVGITDTGGISTTGTFTSKSITDTGTNVTVSKPLNVTGGISATGGISSGGNFSTSLAAGGYYLNGASLQPTALYFSSGSNYAANGATINGNISTSGYIYSNGAAGTVPDIHTDNGNIYAGVYGSNKYGLLSSTSLSFGSAVGGSNYGGNYAVVNGECSLAYGNGAASGIVVFSNPRGAGSTCYIGSNSTGSGGYNGIVFGANQARPWLNNLATTNNSSDAIATLGDFQSGVTPSGRWVMYPNGFCQQWGSTALIPSSGTMVINYPKPPLGADNSGVFTVNQTSDSGQTQRSSFAASNGNGVNFTVWQNSGVTQALQWTWVGFIGT